MELINTGSERRVWHALQTTDGRTLALGSGEVADVAVDEVPNDPYLRPAQGGKTAAGRNPRTRGGKAVGGLEDTPDVVPAAPDDDTQSYPSSTDPAEADASGKEA